MNLASHDKGRNHTRLVKIQKSTMIKWIEEGTQSEE
jgi:hypothetical protein